MSALKNKALKLALEALQWNCGGEPLPTLELQAINAIKEALAQPEQEPHCYMDEYGYVEGEMKQYMEEQGGWFPVYTAPPQRKPLMDWEISNVYFDATGQGLRLQDKALAHKFARAIEAAHGIKE